MIGRLQRTLLGTFLSAFAAESSLEKKGDHSANVGVGAQIDRLVRVLIQGAISMGLLADKNL